MQKDNDNKPSPFDLELGNHSPEGIDILSSEPSKLISSTIYLLFALILCAFIWSFVGKSDVIVMTEGIVTPDSKIKRINLPLEGELIDLYVVEGMTVKKNDVIARMHVPNVIQYTNDYVNAKLLMAKKENDLERFLAHNKMIELETASSQQYNPTNMTPLKEEKKDVDTRIEYEQEIALNKKEEAEIRNAIRDAKRLVESTARIAPKNIDEEGFLKILSPYSGIITELAINQPGEKIQANTTLAGVIPTDSKLLLEIEIPESKRALLSEGRTVKLKINAFAYQRYGFITGRLDYIAPTTRISQNTRKPYYKGQVSLDKTYFILGDTQYPLRYGMTAIAEIVVRQKRIIDFLLDPSE